MSHKPIDPRKHTVTTYITVKIERVIWRWELAEQTQFRKITPRDKCSLSAKSRSELWLADIIRPAPILASRLSRANKVPSVSQWTPVGKVAAIAFAFKYFNASF